MLYSPVLLHTMLYYHLLFYIILHYPISSYILLCSHMESYGTIWNPMGPSVRVLGQSAPAGALNICFETDLTYQPQVSRYKVTSHKVTRSLQDDIQ